MKRRRRRRRREPQKRMRDEHKMYMAQLDCGCPFGRWFKARNQAKNPGAILSQRNNWRLRETGLQPAVHQANSRGKADRFVLSSATKSPPDSGPDTDSNPLRC